MIDYNDFLTAELLFQRDLLRFHKIKELNREYRELLGRREEKTEVLSLAIQILRRKLALLEEGNTPYMAEKITEKEFYPLLLPMEKGQEKEADISPSLSAEEKELCRELYRQLLIKFSPQLHRLNEEEEKLFAEIQKAFQQWDLPFLREQHKKISQHPISVSKEEQEELRNLLKEEIAQLYETFPLNREALLKDPRALAYNQHRLDDICEEYMQLYSTLEEEYSLKSAQLKEP